MALRISVIVCAHNEARHLPACLHSLLAQSRTPDEILVINNASTDATRTMAHAIPHVRVVDEPRKGLVVARETGRLSATGDILVYVDADCRAPLMWLARIERRFLADSSLLALSGPYRFYDWDWWGRLLIREALPVRGQQRLPQTEAPVFLEDARARREELAGGEPCASRERRHRAHALPQRIVGGLRSRTPSSGCRVPSPGSRAPDPILRIAQGASANVQFRDPIVTAPQDSVRRGDPA
jgi:Glycosyl transferase family 2